MKFSKNTKIKKKKKKKKKKLNPKRRTTCPWPIARSKLKGVGSERDEIVNEKQTLFFFIWFKFILIIRILP